MMRTIFIAAAAGLLLAGCNTVAGFGEDVSATGHAFTNAANDASGKNKPAHRTAKKSTRSSRTKQAKASPCSGPHDGRGSC